MGLFSRFRFNGLSWLGPVLFVVTVVAAGASAQAAEGDGGPSASAGFAMAAAFLAGGAVNWLLGFAVNSTSTPQGRTWHNRHSIENKRSLHQVPLQNLTGLWVAVALLVASAAVGRATSVFVGIVAFVALVLVAVGVYSAVYSTGRSRQRLAGMADREELAEARGWHYRDRVSDLSLRWKDLLGWRAATMAPYGVIGGELDGLPFTVFDADVGFDGKPTQLPRTTWVVHLPVAYPRFHTSAPAPDVVAEMLADPVIKARFDTDSLMESIAREGGGPEDLLGRHQVTADDIEPHTELPRYAAALFTDEVREATSTYGLVGWRIEGRDLIFTSLEHDAPPAPDEIVGRAGHLVALGHLIPAEATERYGKPPQTEVPLPIDRRTTDGFHRPSS